MLALIPTLLVISAITFFMGFAAPGDPVTTMLGERARPEQVAELRRQYGLDKPPFVQYGRYLRVLPGATLGSLMPTAGGPWPRWSLRVSKHP